MRTVVATLVKELLLLRRDKAGLAVLFLMPAVLVTVISLVQDNILNNTGTKDVKVVFKAGAIHVPKELLSGLRGSIGPKSKEEEVDWRAR